MEEAQRRLSSLQKLEFKHQYNDLSDISDEQVTEIMEFLKYLNENSINLRPQAIADQLGTTDYNIRRWRTKLLSNPSYNPKYSKHFEKLALKPELEDIIIFILEFYFIRAGVVLNTYILRSVAIRCAIRFPDLCRRQDFMASPKWCYNFRKRHDLTYRKYRVNKTTGANVDDFIASIRKFEEDKSHLIKEHAQDQFISRLINMDETMWRYFAKIGMTFAKKGSERVLYSTDNAKAGVTAVASVTYDGQKLPLIILEKSPETYSRLTRENDDLVVWENNSGWMSRDNFIRYLYFIRKYYTEYFEKCGYKGDTHIDLIVDTFRAHTLKDEEFKKICDDLNITIHLIPPGATGISQPLDKNIFGALKMHANKLFWLQFIRNRNCEFSAEQSIQILIRAWKDISVNTIQKGWTQAEFLDDVNTEEDDLQWLYQMNNKYPNLYDELMSIKDEVVLQRLDNTENDEDEDFFEIENDSQYIVPPTFTIMQVHINAQKLIFISQITETNDQKWEYPYVGNNDFHEDFIKLRKLLESKEQTITYIRQSRNAIDNHTTIMSVIQFLQPLKMRENNIEDIFSNDTKYQHDIDLLISFLKQANKEEITRDFSKFSFSMIRSPAHILNSVLNMEKFGLCFMKGNEIFSELITTFPIEQELHNFIESNRFNPKDYAIFNVNKMHLESYIFPLFMQFKDNQYEYEFHLMSVITKYADKVWTHVRYLCGNKFIRNEKLFIKEDEKPAIVTESNYKGNLSYLGLYFIYKKAICLQRNSPPKESTSSSTKNKTVS